MKRLGSSLVLLRDRMKNGRDYTALSSFLRYSSLWRETVGDAVAASSYVCRCRNGVLYIRCRNSTWANELHLMSQDIIKRLNEECGREEIKDLRFMNTDFNRDAVSTITLIKEPEPEADAETEEAAEKVSLSAKSPELKEAIKKAYIAAETYKKHKDN